MFRLGIPVQATLLSRRTIIEQTTSNRTASDQISKLRPDIPVHVGSCLAAHPSPQRTLPWVQHPQTNHPISDETAPAKTGQHQAGHPSSARRAGIPPRTRHIIISDRTSSDSQAQLRSDWQATAPAQTSKFTLDISVQATLFCRCAAAIEQTRSDQISKFRLV